MSAVHASASTPMGLVFGTQVLVVGVEDNPGGGTRIYINARHLGHYVVVSDPEIGAAVRRAWGNTRSHLLMPRPPADCVFEDTNPAQGGEGSG